MASAEGSISESTNGLLTSMMTMTFFSPIACLVFCTITMSSRFRVLTVLPL